MPLFSPMSRPPMRGPRQADPTARRAEIKGLMAGMGKGQMSQAPAAQGLLGSIQNFLAQNRGEGNFVERLGMFGAELQDLEDGGNRSRQMTADRQAQAEAQQAAARRTTLNKLALGMDLSPRERLVFAASPEEWAKNTAEQFAPQVVSAGGTQVVNGRRTVEQPTFIESGDQTVQRSSAGVAPVYTRTEPSISERNAAYVAETGRINANNPVTVAPNALLVDPRTGATVASGIQRPDIVNVAPGGTAVAFDASGQPVNEYQSTAPRPVSDADQTAIASAERTLAGINTSVGRAAQLRSQIQSGELNLGLLENSASAARNYLGRSDPNSRNYANLTNWAREARDAILAANTGVQTDQDAIRALDRILSNPNDEQVVLQSLDTFERSSRATSQALTRDIQRRSGGGQAASQNPIAEDAQGNRVQWNGQAWVPI